MFFINTLIFSLLLNVAPVLGDTGRILTDNIEVREDYQKAIILHNLDEEVLILGTDLVSNRDTKIIRFIPFPSEPKVSLDEGNPFERVFELIKKYDLTFLFTTKGMDAPSSSPVDMRFNARLGAHDVTIVKINQIEEFGAWVKKFLDDKGLSQGKGFEEVEGIAADYVKRGISYFVFDLVEIKTEIHFIRPLVYRFKSKELYYPLKTSNTFGGTGGIDLVVITPMTLCEPLMGQDLYSPQKELYSLYPCMKALGKSNSFSYPVKVSTSAEVSTAETVSIYAPAGELFQEGESIFMQLIRYRGEYDFDNDILIDFSQAPREKYDQALPNEIVPPYELFMLENTNKLK